MQGGLTPCESSGATWSRKFVIRIRLWSERKFTEREFEPSLLPASSEVEEQDHFSIGAVPVLPDGPCSTAQPPESTWGSRRRPKHSETVIPVEQAKIDLLNLQKLLAEDERMRRVQQFETEQRQKMELHEMEAQFKKKMYALELEIKELG